MSMTDPIADMITRIRNGQQAKLSSVDVRTSRVNTSILDVLKREGYIRGYSKVEDSETPLTKVELKYVNGDSVIKIIKRVSKPGRRVYSKIGDLKKYFNGLGIVILSTSKGVMSDFEASQNNAGGEVICCVF